MTSLHKALTIIMIWVAVAVGVFYISGYVMLNWLTKQSGVAVIVALSAAAALSTWWSTRAQA